ncbi:DUF4214 domain-containing protein [Methylobacterium soli]|uniref:DUF4214 domain-containing protein n=1 Tax=Methylobacterium soli TaxID=553447 RepID=A0A6L3SSU9_9HYPH|nr:DUF4214 domain-containing protein [Methylobacterium soli]KAB1072378.1 DUF4214 domain-containing protein [Methylobacterium soli]GJE41419.1 hypothetical protein AEGHOMDF_0585 [Methylobacterium soli]
MTFAYTIALNDPGQSSQAAALVRSLSVALDTWSNYLGGYGTINIQLNVQPLQTGVLAQAAPGTQVQTGTDGGRVVFQSGAITELLTGADANGIAPDVSITVNSQALTSGQLYLRADPSVSSFIPSRSYDAITVLTHELGHAFGVVGYRNTSTGARADSAESVWDKLVVVEPDGTAVFTGAHAVAAYGAPVPVTTIQNGSQYYHLGSVSGDAASAALMTGLGLPAGTIRGVSDLDLAVLKDLGAPVLGAATTGSQDTGYQINSVYRAVLQRSASLSEQQFWLAQETAGVAPNHVRTAITTSAEADAYVDPIVRLYSVAFGRVPDQGGLNAHVNALQGNSLFSVAANFVKSPEFAQLHGATSVTDTLLQSFYANALGRFGSAGELESWKASGRSVEAILVGFSESPEFQGRSQAKVQAFLDAAAHGAANYTGPLIEPIAVQGIANQTAAWE